MKVLNLKRHRTADESLLLADPLCLAAARGRNRDLVAGTLHRSILVGAALICFDTSDRLGRCEELLGLIVGVSLMTPRFGMGAHNALPGL